MNKECVICSEQNCTYERCQDILKAIEEIKVGEHSIEQMIEDLWP